MIKITFSKPPRFTLFAYIIGLIVIGFTVTHQTLQLNLLSSVLNQQIFIGGAIVVVIGSIFSWISPYLKSKKNPDTSNH